MQETQNELLHSTIGVYLYSNNGELGNTKEQNYTEYQKCNAICTARKALNSFLLVRWAHGHTYAHTHTHTQEMVADAFNTDFSSEGQMS